MSEMTVVAAAQLVAAGCNLTGGCGPCGSVIDGRRQARLPIPKQLNNCEPANWFFLLTWRHDQL